MSTERTTAVSDGSGDAVATQNGNGPQAVTFPLSSFREAAPHLRRPFTVQAVKFKPQSMTKNGKTLCVAYIDARLAVERLNMIVPHLWHDEYEPLGGKHLICRLTVDGITRQDIGEGTGKALYSDALKRAAVKFGIGVSLYAIPAMFLDGKVEYLNEGSRELRDLKARYKLWLEQGGTQAFGDPLDHGDTDDGQGDHEADPPAPPASNDTVVSEATPKLGDAKAADLILNAESAGVDRERLRKAVGHALGRDCSQLADDALAVKVLADLTPAQGERVDKWIEKQRPPVAA